jgi:hypothetical protein
MEWKTEKQWMQDEATNNQYRIDVRDYLKEVEFGATIGRVRNLNYVLNTLNPNELRKLRIEECADEYTGVRYGNANKRRGYCFKIGGGGRNRGQRYAYQLWAVWN